MTILTDKEKLRKDLTNKVKRGTMISELRRNNKMTTKEFKNFLRKHFRCKYDGEYIFNENCEVVASIKEGQKYNINTSFIAFDKLDSDTQSDLLVILMDYAGTDISDREPKPKYIFRTDFEVVGKQPNTRFIRRSFVGDSGHPLMLGGATEEQAASDSGYHFTDEQIESYSEKIQNLFKACEKMEVTSYENRVNGREF